MKLERAIEARGEARGRLSMQFEIARRLSAQGASLSDEARLVALTVAQLKVLQAEIIEEA